jgi:hypothetical protein
MSLSRGYLTPKQTLVWRLKSKGYTEADIGRKLNISRQTVHKAVKVANQKIRQSLVETAKINKIEIRTISLTQGYLTGYNPHFNTNAFVIFSHRNGIQICHNYEENCGKCSRVDRCMENLLEKARNRKIDFVKETNQTSPSKIAHALFSTLKGKKKNE